MIRPQAEKNTTWKQILEQPAAPATPQTATQDTMQANHAQGDPARDFQNLELVLSRSEKGGIGWNSRYFNRVKAALRELLTACQAYTARNPRTQSGKMRRDLVLQIQKYAAQDSIGCEQSLSEFITMTPALQAQETWKSVIQRARSVQLTVEDLSELTPETKGQASEVFKIESQEGNHTVTKFFKKEDSMDMDAVKKKGVRASFGIALQQTLEKFPDLSDNDKKLFKKLKHDTSSDADVLKGMGISKEGIDAAKYMISCLIKMKNIVDNGYVRHIGIVDEGGTANMTRRNVATSRIAELLGLGKLVAKSRTVEIHDEATGKTIRGNLMDKAEGVEYGDEITGKLRNNEISSGFLRELANLQVLDVLCGQADRNSGNMMYQIAGGKLSGIQAIDNDASFGTNTDVASATVHHYKDARVFDAESGEMVVPYMDDELARRIENLNSDMVQYVLADLLKKEEIKAFIQRLDKMKEGIQKARKEHPERFLKSEEEWTVSKTGQSQAENDSSVEGAFMKKYNEERELANNWTNSNMIQSTAGEMFKDDPETLEAILLYEKDQKQFEATYENKADQKNYFMKKREEVIQKNKSILLRKHWPNRNYVAKTIRSYKGDL